MVSRKKLEETEKTSRSAFRTKVRYHNVITSGCPLNRKGPGARMSSPVFHHPHRLRVMLLLCLWSIYLWTGATAPTYYDTGELTTAAAVLGSGHPPGQPLFSQLGALSTLFPVGSLLTRLAWMSSLLTLGVLWLITCCGHLLLDARPLQPSTDAASRAPLPVPQHWVLETFLLLSVGLSLPLWLQAHRPEVYALHLLLVMAGLWLALSLWRNQQQPTPAPPDVRVYFALAGVLGLGMGNHHLLVVLTLPGLGVLSGLPPRRTWLPLLLMGGLTASLYLFLPLRAEAGALLSWGQPDSWERFYAVVTARAYQRSFQHLELRHVLNNLELHAALAMQLWGTPLLLLGGMGIFRLRRQTRLLVGLTLLLVGNLSATVGQTVFFPDNPDALGYLSLSWVLLGLLAGLGWLSLLTWLHGLLQRLSASWLRQAVVGVLTLSLGLIPASRAWPQPSLAAQDSQQRLGKRLLRGLEPGARLFVGSDASSFAVWYQQGVLYARPDVQVLSPYTSENAQGMRLPPPRAQGQGQALEWPLPVSPPLVEAQQLQLQLERALKLGRVGLVGLDLPLPLTERLRISPARFMLMDQPGTPLLSGLDETLAHWAHEAVRLQQADGWRQDRQGRLLYGASLEQAGDWLLELSLPRLALRVYRQVERLDPDPLRLVRLKRFRLEQQLAQAAPDSQTTAGTPPFFSSDPLWQEGTPLVENGMLEPLQKLLEAQRLMLETSGRTPSPVMRWLLAWQARLEGQPSRARVQVRALLEQLPVGDPFRGEVLRVFSPLLDEAEAITRLREQLQSRFEGRLAAQLGFRLWQAQASEAAEQLISSALKLAPEQAELYVMQGWLRVSQGRLVEALGSAQQAARLNPVLPEVLRLQSYLYRNGLR